MRPVPWRWVLMGPVLGLIGLGTLDSTSSLPPWAAGIGAGLVLGTVPDAMRRAYGRAQLEAARRKASQVTRHGTHET